MATVCHHKNRILDTGSNFCLFSVDKQYRSKLVMYFDVIIVVFVVGR